MLLAAARPNMAKLTPALLHSLIFDLMQLMAYFTASADNSKYLTSDCIVNGHNLYCAEWLSGWYFQTASGYCHSQALLMSECWCLILWVEKSWSEMKFSFFCQVKPTVTCVVMIWYELWLTLHEVTVPDKLIHLKKQSVMFTCKHCFSTNTVLTWLMKDWNMVMSERYRNIKVDEVCFFC